MTDPGPEIAQRMLALRAHFAHHPVYEQLEGQFDRLLSNRRVEVDKGEVREARAIALIGASGSGKSTAIDRLLTKTPGLILPQEGQDHCDVVSLMVPSPATLKSVGRSILEALGRPLRRERTTDAIWELVRGFLKERKVLFLHLDEAQDIARHQTPKEMQSVINTLKSLMQSRSWPVGLILSGMPGLKDLLNYDPQLARRVFPLELPRLSPLGDIGEVRAVVGFYSAEVGIPWEPEATAADVAARLIHAADREFGLLIEMTIDGLEEALHSGASSLSVEHFAAAFSRRSGCIAGLNPFIADEYERIDVRKLLGREGEE